MTLIDTHTHLFAEEFKDDIDEVITRSKASGVTKFLLPNIDASTLDDMLSLCEKEPACLPMIGVHPCSVKENYKEELAVVERELFMVREDSNYDYVAIGECGLDYYWDIAFKEEQKAALRQQAKWAKELKLPLAIHTRNSFEDAFLIMKEEQDGNLTGVFHCFGGSIEDAKAIIDIGFYMGIGGVLTFKKSGLDETLKHVPLEYLVLETDSPYLAPTPFRGKRNESSYLLMIAEKLATVKCISVVEVARITSENASKLFSL